MGAKSRICACRSPRFEEAALVSDRLFPNRVPKAGALVRIDAPNNWEEADIKVALKRPYGSPFVAANALFVGYGVPEVR
jgi:hypothetical protein